MQITLARSKAKWHIHDAGAECYLAGDLGLNARLSGRPVLFNEDDPDDGERVSMCKGSDQYWHTLLEVVSPYEELWQSVDLRSGDVIRCTVTKEKIEVPEVLDELMGSA